LDNHPISCYHLDQYFQVEGKLLQEQYKEPISEYGTCDQKSHADDWMLFSKNVSSRVSIDETALSNGELYNIVTNKEAKGRKGAIVAMIKGAVAEDIIAVLRKIPERSRKRAQEITMDMAANMQLAIKRCLSMHTG
jgi:hypothetical protein